MNGTLRRYGGWSRRFNAIAAIWLAAFVSAFAASAPSFAQTSPAGPGQISLLVLGDSLAAGYGLAASEAFPAQLERALKAKGHNVKVINAGVSGDTTAGGRARLEWSLADAPQAVIVELGANDGLRGLEPTSTADNLDAILAALKSRGLPTLLAGMYAPPNLGAAYGKEFNAIYPRLAERHGALLYPFFLDGVAAEAALNQGDGIHPNAKGVAVIVERILPSVEKLLAAARQ
ncbi:MAG: arylesterase [Alphaproteobacteria bacterium]